MTTVRNARFWVKIFPLYPLTFVTWRMLVPQILISNVSISRNIFGHIQKVCSGFWRILLKAKLKVSARPGLDIIISSFLIFLFTNLLLACFREPGRRPPSQLDLCTSTGSRGQCGPMRDHYSDQRTNQMRAQCERDRQQQKPSTKCQIEINVKNGLVCSELRTWSFKGSMIK